MAQIQWYPGHMHKAAKEIREALPQVDMFLELLDARVPYSSENPMLAELRGDKPVIKVMTKSDLADPERTKQWQQWYEQERATKTLVISKLNRQQIKTISQHCRSLFPQRDEKLRPVTVMVVGIPNVGKSSIINILAERTIAKTGNEAAVTRHQQRINLDHGIIILDTPGVLWPNVENPKSGYRLAATGAIRDSAITHVDVAWFISGFLQEHYPNLIEARYQFKTTTQDPAALLDHIGHQRGCLKSGGKVDLDRVAKILIGELRDNSIGKITLETPEMMLKEMAGVEVMRIEKAEKKAARKKNWKHAKK